MHVGPNFNEKRNSDFNDIYVYNYKPILNKTQMGMYQKQLNPSKSTTQKQKQQQQQLLQSK